MNEYEYDRSDAITSYLQRLCGGNVENSTLPECPECGAVACVEHLDRWYYCSPDPRDEE